MNFSTNQRQLLRQLEFSNDEIMRLSELDKDELNKALAQQKRKVSFKYHPDKTKGAPQKTQRFLTANQAYDTLTTMEGFKPSIFDMVDPIDYDIPLDCIDARMQEQIEDYFDKIQAQFLSLASEEEKRDCVLKHRSFLQLVDWLNKNRFKIDQNRVEVFRQVTELPSLFNSLYLDWNQLLLKHFAEENLDDITYREAIALGHYSHILALRKLISPIKWLSFLASGLYDVVTIAMMHYFTKMLISTYRDFCAMASSSERVLPFLLKAAALLAVLTVPFFLVPWPYSIMLFCLPLLTRTLNCLANPFNQIIRPVSEYFNISLSSAGIGVVLLATLGSAAFAVLTLSASAITTLFVLAIALEFLNLLATVAMLKQLHETLPGLAYMLGGLIVLSSAVTLFSGVDAQIPVETLADVLLLCMMDLSNLGLSVLGYISLSRLKEQQSELYTTLPYPEQKAPEGIKEVVNNVSKKTNWSYSLFNTPVNAETESEAKPRTSRQEMGLFGQRNEEGQSSGTPLLLEW